MGERPNHRRAFERLARSIYQHHQEARRFGGKALTEDQARAKAREVAVESDRKILKEDK